MTAGRITTGKRSHTEKGRERERREREREREKDAVCDRIQFRLRQFKRNNLVEFFVLQRRNDYRPLRLMRQACIKEPGRYQAACGTYGTRRVQPHSGVKAKLFKPGHRRENCKYNEIMIVHVINANCIFKCFKSYLMNSEIFSENFTSLRFYVPSVKSAKRELLVCFNLF